MNQEGKTQIGISSKESLPTPDELLADESEAASGVNKVKNLAERRPAELGTFISGVVILAAAFGLDVSQEVLGAGFLVIMLLPSVISYLVTLYRESLYGAPPSE